MSVLGLGAGVAAIWPLRQAQPVCTLDGDSTSIHAVALRPGGMQLATGHGRGQVRIWRLEPSRVLLPALQAHPGEAVLAASFLGAGPRTVSLGEAGDLVLGDLHTGSTMRTSGRQPAPLRLLVDPRGELILTVGEESVTIWSARNGERIRTLTGCSAAAFSRDGARLAFGDRQGRVWIAPSEAPDTRLLLDTPGGIVRGLAFSPSGDVLYCTTSALVAAAFPTTPDGGTRWRLSGRRRGGASIQPLATSGRLLVLEDNGLSVVDASTGQELWNAVVGMFLDRSCEASRSGSWIAYSVRNELTIANAATGGRQVIFTSDRGEIRALAAHPDGGLLAIGTVEGRILLLDVPGGHISLEYRGKGSAIRDLEISADGMWILAADEAGALGRWPIDPAAAGLLPELRTCRDLQGGRTTRLSDPEILRFKLAAPVRLQALSEHMGRAARARAWVFQALSEEVSLERVRARIRSAQDLPGHPADVLAACEEAWEDRYAVNNNSWSKALQPPNDEQGLLEVIAIQERLCAMQPEMPFYLDTLAWLHFRLACFREKRGLPYADRLALAADTLTRACKAAPAYTGTEWTHGDGLRAMILHRQGRIEEADAARARFEALVKQYPTMGLQVISEQVEAEMDPPEPADSGTGDR